MNSPLLRVEDLCIDYRDGSDDLHAVRSVSLSIERGQSLGIVGESGSGKSTLGLGLMRYLPPNGCIRAGSISFDGSDLTAMGEPELRALRGRRIAMVYQDPAAALNPSLTVGEQVAEVYREHFDLPSATARERVVALFGRVQLPDADAAYSRYPHEFSGGQLQRIVIAMALAGEPDLLILDEPTTGLDVTIEAEIMALIAGIQESTGAAALFISHDITLVAEVCQQIAVMYAGQIVETGDTAEVLCRPAHGYTRALLDCAIPFGASKADLTLEPIAGQTPRVTAEVPGCSFASRCGFAGEGCTTTTIALQPLGPGRQVRCIRAAAVLAADGPARPAKLTTSQARPCDATGTLLRTSRLRKLYRSAHQDVLAVVDASIELRRGEILGIVGESGSGKTTLARLVAGLVEASGGKIHFDDSDITRPARRRPRSVLANLQMVFQHPDGTLNPRWQVRRLLRRSLHKLTGLRGAELDARIDEIAKQTQLSDRQLERFPRQLSGGQKQRVAIARAFGARPALVVCDEPTSSLDVSAQAAILRLLVDLQRTNGTSYIYISHDLATVRYLADRVAVMYLGEVVESGTAADVFAHPHHPYTRALLSVVRSLDARPQRKRARLQGSIPSPSERPTGCPFQDRCPERVGPACTQPIPWREADAGHGYRCVLPLADPTQPDSLAKESMT